MTTNDYETKEYQAWKAAQDAQEIQERESLVEDVERAETALLQARAALVAWDTERSDQE